MMGYLWFFPMIFDFPASLLVYLVVPLVEYLPNGHYYFWQNITFTILFIIFGGMQYFLFSKLIVSLKKENRTNQVSLRDDARRPDEAHFTRLLSNVRSKKNEQSKQNNRISGKKDLPWFFSAFMELDPCLLSICQF